LKRNLQLIEKYPMKIAIIDYNAGNVKSVIFALKRLGIEAVLTNNHTEISSADKVIFPGVGEASSTMEYLKYQKLDVLIKNLKQPVLGICLGMQLMCSFSEERNTDCFGIFPYKVLKFNPIVNATQFKIKVPHMGWNNIYNLKTKLFEGISENAYMYFVHSYYVEKSADTIAECHYIQPFSAALHKDNFYAAQFHPEKSGDVGSKILKNFIHI